MGIPAGENFLTWFILFLKKIKSFFKHFNDCHKDGHCSWCGKYKGNENLETIWYTETLDHVCKTCLNPPNSLKFIRSII